MSAMADYYHSTRTRRILAQLVRVACPPEAETLGLVQDVVDRLESGMQASPDHIRALQLLGLNAFEEVARAYPFAPGKPFSAHGAEAARRYYASWWSSPIGLQHEFARLFKALIAVEFYELPEIKQRLEYHPERWIAKVAKRRLERYSAAVREADAKVLAADPIKAGMTLGEVAEAARAGELGDVERAQAQAEEAWVGVEVARARA